MEHCRHRSRGYWHQIEPELARIAAVATPAEFRHGERRVSGRCRENMLFGVASQRDLEDSRQVVLQLFREVASDSPIATTTSAADSASVAVRAAYVAHIVRALDAGG